MASDRGGKTRIKGKCPYCGAAVKEENLPRHLRSVHPGRQQALSLAKDLETEARRAKPKARGPAYGGGLLASKAFLALIIAVVVIVAGITIYIFLPQSPAGADPELTEPIGQICYGNEAVVPALHRHTLLHIIFNNQSMTIPPGIGIPTSSGGLDTCWRPVHTHTADGTLHIEPRIPRAYTLGDFFALWALNQPSRTIRFDATHILDKEATSTNGASLRVQVNGAFIPSQSFTTQVLVDPSLPASSDPGHIFIYYTGP